MDRIPAAERPVTYRRLKHPRGRLENAQTWNNTAQTRLSVPTSDSSHDWQVIPVLYPARSLRVNCPLLTWAAGSRGATDARPPTSQSWPWMRTTGSSRRCSSFATGRRPFGHRPGGAAMSAQHRGPQTPVGEVARAGRRYPGPTLPGAWCHRLAPPCVCAPVSALPRRPAPLPAPGAGLRHDRPGPCPV